MFVGKETLAQEGKKGDRAGPATLCVEIKETWKTNSD